MKTLFASAISHTIMGVYDKVLVAFSESIKQPPVLMDNTVYEPYVLDFEVTDGWEYDRTKRPHEQGLVVHYGKHNIDFIECKQVSDKEQIEDHTEADAMMLTI